MANSVQHLCTPCLSPTCSHGMPSIQAEQAKESACPEKEAAKGVEVDSADKVWLLLGATTCVDVYIL